MCTSLVFLNAPTIVKLCIFMSFGRVEVRREELFWCQVWFRISKRWAIFTIHAWDISPLLQKIAETRKKTCIVIWFTIWLVKTGVFPKVTLLLYVQGHTNNYAECPFNIMKGKYHNKFIYIYIFQEMVGVFNYH